MPVVDEVSPEFVGEDRLVLTLSDETRSPSAFNAVRIDVDYSGVAPEGVVLPLVMTIRPPTRADRVQRTFRRRRPKALVFFPREGGQYLVQLRECFHNRWFGSILVAVAGDSLRDTIENTST